MSILLDSALDYIDRGYSVIPLRFDGDVANRKRPLLPSWLEFQLNPPGAQQVRDWWEKWPEANVGIVTGDVSGLVVIDLDGKNATELLKEKGLLIPETAAVQTGNGYHAFFSYGGREKIQNRTRMLSDDGSAVDVRGEGGYVVAPPSIHGSGRVYKWARSLDELKSLPAQFEDFLLSGGFPEPELNGTWWDTVKGGVESGARNDSAARVAGYWVRKCNGDEEAALRATILWNKQNRPPLPEDELKTTVASVARRHSVRVKAEAAKEQPKQQVVNGEAWSKELETAQPRSGLDIEMPGLDVMNGLVAGDLLILAGRPGQGKSTYACQATAQAILGEVSTLVISSEMSRAQWGRWVATVLHGGTYQELPRPLPRGIVNFFRGSAISIVDSGSISIEDIRKIAEGIPGLRFLIVDHITRIQASGRKGDRRDLEVGEVCRGLKTIAKDQGLTCLALMQLNRMIESRDSKRPRLADLRDSGVAEEEADGVAILYSPVPINKDDDVRPMVLAWEKNRHGSLRNVKLNFLTSRRMFEPALGVM